MADRVDDPFPGDDPHLVAALRIRIRQHPHKHGAHEEVLDEHPLDELVAGLVRVRLPEQPRRDACPVSLPGVLTVSDVGDRTFPSLIQCNMHSEIRNEGRKASEGV